MECIFVCEYITFNYNTCNLAIFVSFSHRVPFHFWYKIHTHTRSNTHTYILAHLARVSALAVEPSWSRCGFSLFRESCVCTRFYSLFNPYCVCKWSTRSFHSTQNFPSTGVWFLFQFDVWQESGRRSVTEKSFTSIFFSFFGVCSNRVFSSKKNGKFIEFIPKNIYIK